MKQSELLLHVIDLLEKMEITYMLVGSFASGAYGEPRLTQDIDIVIEIGEEQVVALCRAFPAPNYYVSLEAAREAVCKRRQFNVIHPASGNKIDFMIARNDEWGRSQLARRQQVQILPGCTGFVAAPEDVILGKLIYYQEGGSEKHLRDIMGMLRINDMDLDTDYISNWAEKIDLAEVWKTVQTRLETDSENGQ